jgi:hypothetical protein
VITLVSMRLQKGMYGCLSAVCIMTGTDLGRPKIECVQNRSVLKGFRDAYENGKSSQNGPHRLNSRAQIQVLCFDTALEKAV